MIASDSNVKLVSQLEEILPVCTNWRPFKLRTLKMLQEDVILQVHCIIIIATSVYNNLYLYGCWKL